MHCNCYINLDGDENYFDKHMPFLLIVMIEEIESDAFVVTF